MGFNCFKATEPLGGRDSLLFTTKFPEIPGTHLIDLGARSLKLIVGSLINKKLR